MITHVRPRRSTRRRPSKKTTPFSWGRQFWLSATERDLKVFCIVSGTTFALLALFSLFVVEIMSFTVGILVSLGTGYIARSVIRYREISEWVSLGLNPGFMKRLQELQPKDTVYVKVYHHGLKAYAGAGIVVDTTRERIYVQDEKHQLPEIGYDRLTGYAVRAEYDKSRINAMPESGITHRPSLYGRVETS